VRVIVFGATGGIGRHVVERAVAAGHEVVAVSRDASKVEHRPGVSVVGADIVDAPAVARAVAGADAVVWAVGPTSNSADEPDRFERGAQNLVAGMRAAGAKRLVALSGAGITLRDERKPLAGRLMTALVAVLARHVVESKRREYEVFSDSGLDWTLVRPPRVVDQPPRGSYQAGEALAGRSVTQGDLAQFMVDALADRQWVGKAPFVS
jgi:putative NADH-flavin reductase